ncbi:MAG: hypothetical protein ACTSQS_05390 [Promethearchaeota archaeon]
MLKKRIAAIIALSMISSITPLIYQYLIEPRMEGANVKIEILGITYNGDESSKNSTAFNTYLKLTNDNENDVVLSPLKLDVYYRSKNTHTYRLIGELITKEDYVIPGTKNGADGQNYVGTNLIGSQPERIDKNEKQGYNLNKEIVGILYFYKTSGFVEGANEALVDLINRGEIDIKLSGNAQFGPISIPYESEGDVSIKLDIWDTDLIIYDVFLFRDPLLHSDTFVLDTLMRNPSGLPLTIDYFELSMYNETGEQVGWPIRSTDIISSFDPTETNKKLYEIFLNGETFYSFSSDEKYTWKHVFFAFNFTDPENPSYNGNKKWLLTKLMDEASFSDIKLKGPARILIGTRDKGFVVDMTEEDNYLELNRVTFYQKYIPKFGDKGKYTGKNPIKMFGNFTVGPLQVNKMVIDTMYHKMTLDVTANILLGNPYRFEYSINNFLAKYVHSSGNTFINSKAPTSCKIWPAYRDPNSDDPTLIITNYTYIPLNLTTTYDTHDSNAGIYKVIEDLGGESRLMNLTNPFYIDSNLYPLEHEKNPIQTIEYLIDQNIDPLTLLNEVSLLRVTRSFNPLRCSHFGNRSRPIDEVIKQASSNTDMPFMQDPRGIDSRTSNFPFDSSKGFNTISPLSNWDAYYDDSTYENNLVKYNQYEIIKYSFSNYFPDDTDLGDPDGAIFVAQQNPERNGAFSLTPLSDLVWRIYEAGGGSNLWGPTYDFYGYGEHGYLIGMDLPNGNRVLFAQNFTLDLSDIIDESGNLDENIKKVTLGITYKYLDPEYDAGDHAFLLFAFWNSKANQYNYTQFGTASAFGGRLGYPLPKMNDVTWDHYSIDLTQAFKNRLSQYETTNDPELLKMEVGFSGWGQDSDTDLRVYFDDIYLNIEYYDYPDSTNTLNTTGMLNLQNLFDYLQNIDPENGNMYKIFYDLSKDGDIDGSTFWNYLANDGDITRNGDGEVDFFRYLQYTNTSLATITDILQNKYQDLDIGEPANFLEMLTKTKYQPIDPNVADPSNDPRFVQTPYGPRFLKDEYWVIEDPLNASRNLVKSLQRTIFTSEDGSTITRPDFYGEELWYMLDKLGVTMPWVVMYLLSHGWTKDDVFDALEALGFGKEVKYDFPDDRDGGTLSTYLHIWGSGLGGIFDFDDNIQFDFDMEPVLSDGIQEIYSILCSSGTKYLVNNHGDVTQPPYYKRITGTIDLIIIQFDVVIDLWVRPEWFEIKIWVDPDPNKLITPPSIPYSSDFISDYLQSGAGSALGLNDAGTKQLMHTLRCNFRFDNKPFIDVGGDIVSFFQFLDTYYFDKFSGIDYSSFQVLHYFNVSAVDFIELITGYNKDNGKFDPNGNGKADDWRAPDEYGAGKRDQLKGWGTNFWDSRLFWNTQEYEDTGQINGAIIWSDSPDFAAQNSDHQKGDIILGDKISGGDRINGGAPPIVDLFDMLAWISETSGKPDPNELMRWLIGVMGPEWYRLVNPVGKTEVPSTEYKQMTNQEVWRMLRRGTLNATGFFDWLENDKSISSFKFLYVLNQSTDTVNPFDLLFFATSPNLIRFFDGEISFMYHSALDSQSTVANDVLWEFFSTNAFNAEGFFKYLDSNNFNIFDLFLNLQINPASWLNLLNNKYGLEPIEIIKRMKKVIPGYYYLEFKSGTATKFDIYGNMTITYQGIDLKNIQAKIADDKVLTADYHFAEFIRADKLTGNNFVIY